MSDTSGFTNFTGPSIIPQGVRDVVDQPLLPRGVRDTLGSITPHFGGRAYFEPIGEGLVEHVLHGARRARREVPGPAAGMTQLAPEEGARAARTRAPDTARNRPRMLADAGAGSSRPAPGLGARRAARQEGN